MLFESFSHFHVCVQSSRNGAGEGGEYASLFCGGGVGMEETFAVFYFLIFCIVCFDLCGFLLFFFQGFSN